MVVLIVLALLGIGLIDYAVCRACSIYDQWSEQKELDEWKREEDDEKED